MQQRQDTTESDALTTAAPERRAPLYCGHCGTPMLGGRPPRPTVGVCVGCLSAVTIDRPTSDLFAMRVSDLALETGVLQRVNQVRAQIRAQKGSRK